VAPTTTDNAAMTERAAFDALVAVPSMRFWPIVAHWLMVAR
jgi:hypothetical protein